MRNKVKFFCIVVNVLQLLAPGVVCQRPLSANASSSSSSTTQTISTLKPPTYPENFDSDSTSLSSSGVVAIENPYYPLQNNSPFKPNRGRKNTFTDLRKNLSAQKKLWERQGDDPEQNENSKNPLWVLKQKFKIDVSFFYVFLLIIIIN